MPSIDRPNRLVVDESTSDDNSVAQLNPATMETLQLFRGDTIIVRGKKRKDTGQFLTGGPCREREGVRGRVPDWTDTILFRIRRQS